MRMRLAVASFALCLYAPLLHAAPPADPVLSQRHNFDIHVQPLSDALRKLAAQSGVRILFPYDVTASIRGRRLQGWMSTQDALTTLLAGTDLTFSRTAVGVFAMHQRQPVCGNRPAPAATSAGVASHAAVADSCR